MGGGGGVGEDGRVDEVNGGGGVGEDGRVDEVNGGGGVRMEEWMR